MIMTEHEAAQHLALSVHTLRAWRAQRRGPAFVRIGRRAIRYRMADLDAYLQQGTVSPVPKTHFR